MSCYVPDNINVTVLPSQAITVVYEYNKQISTITNGSVVATYKDTEGNELFPQMDVRSERCWVPLCRQQAPRVPLKAETVDGLTRTATYI